MLVGRRQYPHIDTDIFSLNVLMMLAHDIPDGTPEPSALHMHYADGSKERFQLEQLTPATA